ncbi:MAG TPA: hypothetical protein ENG00_00025 [Candidatus Aenigmarchaeota archaeon]|nr:hypothetical protein [Candidatus Aenigmarchaeota archaeon]
MEQFLDIEEDRELQELRARSKPLHELVVSENFTVVGVVSKSYRTQFTPKSEMVIGGRSPVYSGGYIYKLILNVIPDNKNIPVRTLNFEGISPVCAGDYISAKIPRYEERKIEPYGRPCCRSLTFYLDRDFRPEEDAIEISIFSEDRKRILRTDRSVDYEEIMEGEYEIPNRL